MQKMAIRQSIQTEESINIVKAVLLHLVNISFPTQFAAQLPDLALACDL
jgi:hypothetical protein